jgi:steroid delta-isomerase-like uncharacterized protein
MSIEQNKELVQRFYQALEEENYDAAAQMCHEDFVFYNQIDTPRPGAAGFIAAEKKHLDAFKGFRMQVKTVAEGDQVGAYVEFEGDQSGEFYGVPARGAHLRMSMFNLFTIADGKMIEKRAHYDRLDHIEQLKAGSR